MDTFKLCKIISALGAVATTSVLLTAVISLADAPPSAIGSSDVARVHTRQATVAMSGSGDRGAMVALAADRASK